MRKSLFLAAAVLFLVSAVPSHASPEKGMLAIGTSWVQKTPVGVRYWFSPKAALDVEIGFWSLDVPTDSGQEKTRFKGQVGIPINLICCSDVWLHFRPFVLFQSTSYEDISGTSVDSTTDIYFGGALEMEAWLTECLTFSVWHGIVIESEDQGSESATNIHLEGSSLGYAGFHFYLP